jgi:hypothetical protein
MKLNGWKRLWIVRAFLWTLIVSVTTYARWPMPSNFASIDPRWFSAIHPGEPIRTYQIEARDGRKLSVRTDHEPTESESDRVFATQAKMAGHALANARIIVGGRAVGIWVVPLIGLYALGWALAWVRRGFAEARETSR